MDTIDICICTFRRDSVAEAIASVQRQAIPDGVVVQIRVIDNDDTSSAQELVKRQAEIGGIPILYHPAPGRNISIARNGALDASSARYVAFLDDDEMAEAGWLTALWQRHRATGAEVVLGPVDPIYPPDAPAWMQSVGIHRTRPVFVQGEIRSGYTCNVLFDRGRADIRALRFDPGLGRSGGEDSDFCARIVSLGGRITYAEDALVTEPVSPERLSFKWLVERRYRMGLTHAGVLMRRHGKAPWHVVSLAFAKLVACGLMVLAFVLLPGRRNVAILRGSLHAGVVAAILGQKTPVLYGGAPDEAPNGAVKP